MLDRRVLACALIALIVELVYAFCADAPFDVDGYRYWGENLAQWWSSGPLPILRTPGFPLWIALNHALGLGETALKIEQCLALATGCLSTAWLAEHAVVELVRRRSSAPGGTSLGRAAVPAVDAPTNVDPKARPRGPVGPLVDSLAEPDERPSGDAIPEGSTSVPDRTAVLAGRIAALMFATYLPLLSYASTLLTEAFAIPLSLAAMVTTVCAIEQPTRRPRLALCAGALLTIATLIRPMMVLQLVIAAGALVLVSRGRRARIALLFCVPVVVLFAPWVARNVTHLGTPQPLGNVSQLNIAYGIHLPYDDALGETSAYDRDLRFFGGTRPDGFDVEQARATNLRETVSTYLRERPVELLRARAFAQLQLWGWPVTARTEEGLSERIPYRFFLVQHVLIVVSGLVGLWKLRRTWIGRIALAISLGTVAVHLAYHATPRFALPVVPLFIIAASAAIALAVERYEPHPPGPPRESDGPPSGEGTAEAHPGACRAPDREPATGRASEPTARRAAEATARGAAKAARGSRATTGARVSALIPLDALAHVRVRAFAALARRGAARQARGVVAGARAGRAREVVLVVSRGARERALARVRADLRSVRRRGRAGQAEHRAEAPAVGRVPLARARAIVLGGAAPRAAAGAARSSCAPPIPRARRVRAARSVRPTRARRTTRSAGAARSTGSARSRRTRRAAVTGAERGSIHGANLEPLARLRANTRA